jgi:hypothetical protein
LSYYMKELNCPVGKATGGIWIVAAQRWRHRGMVSRRCRKQGVF